MRTRDRNRKKMFSLLVALLCVLPLVTCEFNCNPDKQVPGCKATCNDGSSDGQPTVLDISNTFQYPALVKAYDGHNYTYACGGGLDCTDNTEQPHATAVCQDGKRYLGLSTMEVITWKLSSTNPLIFSIEYRGAEGGDGIIEPSVFIFTQVPGSGKTTLVYNGTNPEVTFRVTGECFFMCSGTIAGPIGFALIAVSILVFISYFIVGAIIMRFARGARGVEVIPNFSFWIGLPSLLKDGMLFVIHPCYKKGEYEKI